jgi:hypothetical protein
MPALLLLGNILTCLFILQLVAADHQLPTPGRCSPASKSLHPQLNITTLLSRTWKNELGSVMDLGVWEENDRFNIGGTYTSGVGKASGPYALFGSGTSFNGILVFGWQVVWNNAEADSYSISSWNAYLNTNSLGSGKVSFSALWFLTVPGPVSWNSTETGQDVFRSDC